MPIYEFVCPICGSSFDKLVRSTTPTSEIACPTCGNHQVKKKLSTFATSGANSSTASAGSSATSCSPGGL